MDTDIDGDAGRTLEARLLVHAHRDVPARMSSLHLLLRRLCGGLHLDAEQVVSPMRVQVADLRGRELRCLDTSEPLVELPLPPGTYDVTVTLGESRRRYTMTLAPGASCDLHLRFDHGAA